MPPKKLHDQRTERLSVGVTPDQMRRVEEITRVRSRLGKPVNKADVVREALEFYLMHQEDLPGSRKAIAKAVEAKIAGVDAKVDRVAKRVEDLIVAVYRWRSG